MNDICTWFENEFGYLGFTLTPILYDPMDFSTTRKVLFKPQNGVTYCTDIRIQIQVTNDLTTIYGDVESEIKHLITQMITLFLSDRGLSIDRTPKDFKPKEKINKFNLL